MATLYEQYTQAGQKLPSIQERQSLASQAGIKDYSGSADQNIALSNYISTNKIDLSKPIAASNMSGTSVVIPPAQDTTNYSGTMAGIESNLKQAKTETPVSETESLYNKLISGNQEKVPTSEELYQKGLEETQIKERQKEENDISTQLNQLIAESKQAEASLEGQGRGIPLGIIGGQQARLAKDYAMKALPLQVALASAQGKVKTAQSNLETLFKIYSDDAQRIYDNNKEKRTIALSLASDAEKKKINEAQRKEDQAFDLKKIGIQNQQSLAKTALENGQGSLAQQILSVDPNSKDFDSKIASLTGQVKQKDGLESYNVGDYANLVKLVAQTGGTDESRKVLANNISSFISTGDFDSAYSSLVQAAGNNLKGAAGTTFQSQAKALNSLVDLKKVLQEYKDSGGDMNIFKGTADTIGSRIGVLLTDPRYTEIAKRLDTAFMQFRSNMSGAAFGAKESKQYASVIPSKYNTLDLNSSVLNGAGQYLSSQVDADIKSQFGPKAVDIKEKALGNPFSSQTKTDTNLVLKRAGVTDEDTNVFKSTVGNTSTGGTSFWSSLSNFLTGK